MTFTPTPEQLAIVEAARNTTDNLIVSAYAGAAKTSTLELICRAVTGIPILSLAFNKRIADEMTKRLPSHVKCQTLNSLGHRVWGDAIGKRLNLESGKMLDLVKGEINSLSKEDKAEANEHFMDILKFIGAAKSAGYIPAQWDRPGLISREEYLDSFDERPHPLVIDLLDPVLNRSIQMAYAGTIDFDDQIYMSTLFGGSFPKYPLILVDEAQDLSPLNHEMIAKLVAKRIIAVGDPYQSIYGFRGAMSSGMSHLATRFSMRGLKLSISFRCPQEVVRHAWFRVPDMKWPDWAEPGTITIHGHEPGFDLTSFEEHSAIICRHNAPLFRLGFRLIRSGRGVQIVGADIGPGLIRILKKLGDESMDQKQLKSAIEAWKEKELKKSKRKATVHDRAECLQIFADQGPNLAAAVAYAEHLFKQTGSIQLLSGHKAKGLEWNTVYHLDPWRIERGLEFVTTEEADQELNVKYVILTRAKRDYHELNSDDIHG